VQRQIQVINYATQCSGIEAPSAGFHSIENGAAFRPVFFSEIEPYCCHLLKQRYPETPNEGDFTKIEKGRYGSIRLFVAGTPCQDFSIAGKRVGFVGARGNLTF
jgi:DNA (cytosine-5)-methyltransferase 1